MNVLSLFDGMSCGQIALNRAGIFYDKYYACEIDSYAIEVTQNNYPHTIQLGDVTKVNGSDLPQIDLLIGGSPCQSFSNVGGGEGFEGTSKLFWEYVRLLEELKPKYFLLENVKMRDEWRKVIDNALGVFPIEINSSLVSAQNRPRLYWTNIVGIRQPKNLELVIDDVIDPIFSSDYPNYLNGYFDEKKRKDYVKKSTEKASCLTATMYKGQISSFCKNDNDEYYQYTPNDCEILQTVPLDYTQGVSNTQRFKMLGNGFTVDVIAHILKHMSNKETKTRTFQLSLF